jgi:maleate isomerase
MLRSWRDDSLNGDGRRARLASSCRASNGDGTLGAKVVPDGVSIFASRMFIPPAMTPDAFIEMDRNEGKAAIRQLSSVFPDAIAYGCTASSIVQGPGL